MRFRWLPRQVLSPADPPYRRRVSGIPSSPWALQYFPLKVPQSAEEFPRYRRLPLASTSSLRLACTGQVYSSFSVVKLPRPTLELAKYSIGRGRSFPTPVAGDSCNGAEEKKRKEKKNGTRRQTEDRIYTSGSRIGIFPLVFPAPAGGRPRRRRHLNEHRYHVLRDYFH